MLRIVSNSNSGPNSGLPPALGAALVVAVAALAAVGLTGDALLRAVRNYPKDIAAALIWALIGGAALAVVALIPRASTKQVVTKTNDTETTTTEPVKRWRANLRTVVDIIALVGLGFLVGNVIRLIDLGSQAVSASELPAVTLQISPPAAAPSGATGGYKNGTMEVTVNARAAGMKTTEELTVQILGLTKYTGVSQTDVGLCESKEYSWSNNEPEPNPGPPPESARLLLWNRVGPKADGTIDTSWKLPIPAGQYAGLCACAFGKENSAAYLRLR
jgi:hypothetical protein